MGSPDLVLKQVGAHYILHRAECRSGGKRVNIGVPPEGTISCASCKPPSVKVGVYGPQPQGYEDILTWSQRAACDGADTNIFFPPDKKTSWKPALAYCLRCPVRLHCLHYALDKDIEEGMWGGGTPEQRSNILRQRKGNRIA